VELIKLNGIITVFGIIGLGIWTISSSLERAQREPSGEQIPQFFALLLFRGLFFGITYGVSMSFAESSKYFLASIPALLAGGFCIYRLGKKD
jgi:hypothetical protein